MSFESTIELTSCVIALGLLVFGVPKNKIREAIFSLSMMQSLAFLLSVLTVQLKLISYPVRFFSYVCRTSITFEFLAFPAVSVLYNLRYPVNGSWLKKLLYSIFFPSVITICEYFFEKYTKLIEYLHWNWFLSWISMTITLHIAYKFYYWFFGR